MSTLDDLLAQGGASRPNIPAPQDTNVGPAPILPPTQLDASDPRSWGPAPVPSTPIPVNEGSPAAPELSKRRQILVGLANLVAAGLHSYGRAIEDPRIRMEEEGHQVQLFEALSRLKETKAFHEAEIAQRQSAESGRETFWTGQLKNQADKNAAQQAESNSRLTATLAPHGFAPQWDIADPTKLTGIRKMSDAELSAQEKANIGLTNARTKDVAGRNTRQLEIAAGHDSTRLAVAKLAHEDRQAALAMQSNRPEMTAAHDQFLLSMHDLETQRIEQDRLGYPDYQNSKAAFDKYYTGEQSRLTSDLKSAAQKAGVFAGPAKKGPVTPAEAREYIRRAGGDRDKARKLATAEGRTF